MKIIKTWFKSEIDISFEELRNLMVQDPFMMEAVSIYIGRIIQGIEKWNDVKPCPLKEKEDK